MGQEDSMSAVHQPAEWASDTRWLACQTQLQQQLGDAFQRWFTDMRGTVEAGNTGGATLQLAFPTVFICKWVEEHFGEKVRHVWQHLVPQGQVVFGVDPTLRRLPVDAESTTGQVIQFPAFPTETRLVSNDMARSALFACVQGKDRQMVKDTLIATVDGVEIRFTGERLNQDDHDLLMQLAFMARHKPLGDAVTVPAHAILTSLGRGTSGRDHERLRADMLRLFAASISLRNRQRRIEYFGHLLDKAVQDETSRHWIYQFNPDLRALYDPSAYTLIDWEQRKNLSGKDLTRWLQLYLASHANPFPVKVDTLRVLSGSQAKSLRHFREKLRLALASLQANGDIMAWAIDTDDLVTVKRIPSPTQARHLIGKLTGKSPRRNRKT